MAIDITDLPEGWEETMYEFATDGYSMPTFVKEMGLTVRKHATLKANFPKYSEAVEHSRTLCEAWWHEWGRDNLLTKGVNQGIFSMYMKNMFGWRDTPVAKESKDSILDDVSKDTELEAKFKKNPDSSVTDLVQ